MRRYFISSSELPPICRRVQGRQLRQKKKNQTEEKKKIHTARPVVNRKLSKIQLNPTKGVKQTFNEGQSEVCAIKIGQ
jgi:PPE-repeat protein